MSKALPFVVDAKPRRIVAPDRCRAIIMEVAEQHQLDAASIMERSRRPMMVRARHEIFYRVRIELGWSYPRIGRVFGLDHTTVIWGAGCHAMRLAEAGKYEIIPAKRSTPTHIGVRVGKKRIDLAARRVAA